MHTFFFNWAIILSGVKLIILRQNKLNVVYKYIKSFADSLSQLFAVTNKLASLTKKFTELLPLTDQKFQPTPSYLKCIRHG